MNIYQIYRSHSQIELTTAANGTAQLLESLSCYSKFIAYLEAPQNRNNSFQYALKGKSTLPQSTTIVTPYQIRQGFFSLPDSTSCLPKILMLGSHRTHHESPTAIQSHKGRQQQIPEAPPGDKIGHAACIPAGSVISASKSPYLSSSSHSKNAHCPTIPILRSPVVPLAVRQSQWGNRT